MTLCDSSVCKNYHDCMHILAWGNGANDEMQKVCALANIKFDTKACLEALELVCSGKIGIKT
jgi:hypothetical protein